MGEFAETLALRLRTHARSFTFAELKRVCVHYFGSPRHRGSSHVVFKTGITAPALVNIQPQGKMAKPYQCRQIAAAIEAKTGIEIPR